MPDCFTLTAQLTNLTERKMLSNMCKCATDRTFWHAMTFTGVHRHRLKLGTSQRQPIFSELSFE